MCWWFFILISHSILCQSQREMNDVAKEVLHDKAVPNGRRIMTIETGSVFFVFLFS